MTISCSTHQTASRRNCETGDVITSITNYYGVALVSRIDKITVSFAKESYKRDDILHKRPVILSILRTVATPYAITSITNYLQ